VKKIFPSHMKLRIVRHFPTIAVVASVAVAFVLPLGGCDFGRYRCYYGATG